MINKVMKKLLGRTILVFSLSLFLVVPVSAKNEPLPSSIGIQARPMISEAQTMVGTIAPGAAQGRLEEIREKFRERREEIQEQIEERRGAIRERISEQKKIRIRNFFGRLTRRMEAAISRLERLIARIEARIAKIEAADSEIDTSDAKETLTEAKTKLTEVKAALADAQDGLEDILSAEDPKEAFRNARDLIKGIKEQLIEIHRLLVQAIGEIKGLRVGASESK